MIKIDKKYDEQVITNDPAYPGGKAKDATTEEGVDGTKWGADWFNTILGFFTALIVEAYGSFKVSGTPDKVGSSDLMNAIKKIIGNIVQPDIVDILAAIVDLQGPNDGHLYGRKNLQWSEIIIPPGASGEADVIKALKLYSEKTLMITNSKTTERRLKRYDIGLPYLSEASEVYHFDSDLKNQNQGLSIVLSYTTAPTLVGVTDYNGQVYFNPAISDVPPYEQGGKSLFGKFKISAVVPNTDSTIEFWIRIKNVNNVCVFRLRTETKEELAFIIGGPDPEYSVPGGSIPYSVPGDSIPYSVPVITQNRVEHTSHKAAETLGLSNVAITSNSWIHVAAVATAQKISLFIGERNFDFTKHFQDLQNMDVIINEDKNEINLDELNIDRTTAITIAAFNKNTIDHIPYGGLDYTKNWAVLMFDNPNRVVTNLFESERFKMAVKAAINNSM
jgi:hypothetical protein